MNLAWKKLIHKFLDLILPRLCAGCGAQNESFCASCRLASYKTGAQCLICGFRNKAGKICNTHLPTPIKQILWAGRYDGPLKEAIWQFKYQKRKELAGPLAEMLWKKFCEIELSPSSQSFARHEYSPVGEFLCSPRRAAQGLAKLSPSANLNAAPKVEYVVIPIPLHFKKEHERGFNQAELLAKEFSKLSNFPLLTNSLLKIKETPAQVAVENKEMRIKNLEDAFEVRNLEKAGVVPTIILIDDVSTTGATLLHAATALTKAGAQKIIGLVVAHG